MSVKLIINNETGQPHQNAMPALHSIANTILTHLAHGNTGDAKQFAIVQQLPPIALGFVAACLFKQGIGEKDIEAVLLH